jgi:hypothetical protein
VGIWGGGPRLMVIPYLADLPKRFHSVEPVFVKLAGVLQTPAHHRSAGADHGLVKAVTNSKKSSYDLQLAANLYDGFDAANHYTGDGQVKLFLG